MDLIFTPFKNILEVLKLLKIPWRKTLIFFALGIGVILLLASFTNIFKVGALLVSFPTKLSILILISLVGYFLLKFSLARFLVGRLGLKISLKRILVVFAGGELARELPIGFIFFPLVLSKPELGYPPSIFAAPIVQIVMEVLACFILLSVFGFGQFEIVRYFAIFAVFTIILLLFLFRYLNLPGFLRATQEGKGIWHKTKKAITDIKEGINILINLSTFVLGLALALLYLGAFSTVMYFITQSVDLENITIFNTASVYAMSFFWQVVSPIPVDVGVTESAGFLSLSAFGANRDGALAAMLGFRIIGTGASWFVFSLISWLLFSEIKKMLMVVKSRS